MTANYLIYVIYRGFTYYKMSNLDNRIANADQLLTQDVDKFCDCVAELYSNLSKVTGQLPSLTCLSVYSSVYLSICLPVTYTASYIITCIIIVLSALVRCGPVHSQIDR